MKKSDLYIKAMRERILSNEKKNYKDKRSFLERDMLLFAHSLEKGMGVPKPRKGYGKEKALILVNLIKTYSEKYDINSFAFLESVAVLDKYIELMDLQNEAIDSVKTIRKTINSIAGENNYCHSGFLELSYEDLMTVDYEAFERALSSRHSIRHYSKETIDDDELFKVVAMANKAPSACNRQPVKLYFTRTQEKAREFETMIDGSHGFQGEVPYYMLVTVNRSYFSEDEYLQWYTNGGIYLGYLTLAFQACGIGSIILQWKYAQKCENEVKTYFGIKETEAIVAVVGFGKYAKDGTKCIVAQRKLPEDTLRGI